MLYDRPVNYFITHHGQQGSSVLVLTGPFCDKSMVSPLGPDHSISSFKISIDPALAADISGE